MNRITIFAHHDPQGIVDDYVVHYLKCLKQVSDTIFFVSDGNLPDSELKKVSGLCRKSMALTHDEYDFGSWKRGMKLAQETLTQDSELILCNDSCYGPTAPLDQIWKSMGEREHDFWGLTWGERQHPRHIQSYFMVFKGHVHQSATFRDFLEGVTSQSDKWSLIRKYEIGMSQALIKSGFTADAYIRKQYDLNPTILYSQDLNLQGFPFIKTALLKHNQYGQARLHRALDRVDPELRQQITRHLRRVQPNHAERWNFKFSNQRLKIIHPKIFSLKLTNHVRMLLLRVSIGGIRMLKLPVWPNRPHQENQNPH